MIKIIRKGNKKVTKCVYCDCEFSFNMEDTYDYEQAYQSVETVHGYKEYKRYIKCPQCNNEIDLEKNVTAKMNTEQMP